MNLHQASAIAKILVAELSPYCRRIEIAGSIRRQAPEVKDIELVAIPKVESVLDLFGEEVEQRLLLDAWLDDNEGRIHLHKNGDRYKQFELLDEGVKVDLFLVRPPAQWGALYAIRTGPWQYSKWLVTPQPWGAKPPHLTVRDGALWVGDALIETPEEEDFFAALDQPCPPPDQRQPPK